MIFSKKKWILLSIILLSIIVYSFVFKKKPAPIDPLSQEEKPNLEPLQEDIYEDIEPNYAPPPPVYKAPEEVKPYSPPIIDIIEDATDGDSPIGSPPPYYGNDYEEDYYPEPIPPPSFPESGDYMNDGNINIEELEEDREIPYEEY
jgi:hypothetical protein